MSGCTCKPQFASRTLHLSSRAHNDSNSCAVNVGHTSQIENDLFVMLTDEVFRCPLELLAVTPQGESPAEFEDHNIRLHRLGLNLQHSEVRKDQRGNDIPPQPKVK